MTALFSLRHGALLLSGMAMPSFMGRTFIDYGYVFPEMGVSTADLLPITFGVLAFYGGWLWALIAAGRENRKGVAILLVYNLLLIIFGVSTFTTLCPSPCRTAWPTAEILMWSNVIVGVVAVLLVVLQLRSAGNHSLQQAA